MIYTTDILGDQLVIFLRAAALGLMLGGCYDIWRVVRVFFPQGKAVLIITDALYCLWAGFLMFSFLLDENYGMPRFYIYLAAAAGFIVWYLTLGRLVMLAARFIRRVLSTVLKWISAPVLKFAAAVGKKISLRAQKIKIIFGKIASSAEKLLKKETKVVYNELCLSRKAVFSFCGGKNGRERSSHEDHSTEKNEEKPLFADRSYCLRSVSSVFPDKHTGEHQ